MDSHFNEYLAAVAGMQEVYGQPADDHATEFHDTDQRPGDDHALVAAFGGRHPGELCGRMVF